jgi:hypothetical protein
VYANGNIVHLNLKKVWWHDATLFVYFFLNILRFNTYIHLITLIHHICPSPFAEVSPSLHRFEAQWENLPVVPSRESISGLPYSKPTLLILKRVMNYSTDSMVYIVIMYSYLEKCVNDGIVIGYDNRIIE